MAKKLTLSIPDKLHERLAEHRNSINISNVCAVSLKKEMDKADKYIQKAKIRFEILTTSEVYKLAYEDGMDWAGNKANPIELAIVCNWTYEWLSKDPQAKETIELLEENNKKIKETLNCYMTGYEFIFSNEFISPDIISYPVDYDDVDLVEIAVAFSQGAQVIWNELKNRLLPKLIIPVD